MLVTLTIERVESFAKFTSNNYAIGILGRSVKLRVSTSAIRTVEKHGGIDPYLIQARNSELADEARALKSEIIASQKS